VAVAYSLSSAADAFRAAFVADFLSTGFGLGLGWSFVVGIIGTAPVFWILAASAFGGLFAIHTRSGGALRLVFFQALLTETLSATVALGHVAVLAASLFAVRASDGFDCGAAAATGLLAALGARL
jgi:hypothetical protein